MTPTMACVFMGPRSTGDKIKIATHNIKALRLMVLEEAFCIYFIRCRYMGANVVSGWGHFQPQWQHLLDLCIVKHHTISLHT